MIFLLNRERVLSEVMELARLRIAGALKVDPDKVEAKVEVDGAKLMPNFSADVETSGALEVDYLQKTMADTWLTVAKPQLVERLAGLSEGRYVGEEKESTPEV